MEYSLAGSSVHGILNTRILQWVAMPFRGSSRPRDQDQVSWTAGRFFTLWTASMHVCVHLLQSCLTLGDLMDCSSPMGFLCPWNFPGKSTGVGWPCPSPGDLPGPWMESVTLTSPALAGGFFLTASTTWEGLTSMYMHN